MLTVADGEDEATLSQTVVVGEEFEYGISGGFGGSYESEEPFLTGVPITPTGEFAPRLDFARLLRAENPAKGRGYCYVVFGSEAKQAAPGDVVVSLRAALDHTLREGSYPITSARNSDREVLVPQQGELRKPNSFMGGVTIGTGTPLSPGTVTFETRGGSVQIGYYDGDRIEITFSANLEEYLRVGDIAAEPHRRPRLLSLSGSFSHNINRDVLNGKFPDWYLCDPAENLVVEDYFWSTTDSRARKPFEGNNLVDFEDPEIEMRLSEEYDLDSFFDGGFRVELLRPNGSYEEVLGFLMGEDDHTVKFVPLENLRDGVQYRAILESGVDGVRGLSGETLEEDFEWTFETLLDLGKSNYGIGLGLFQVIQDAPLVPGKTTLTRVYLNWEEKDDVHPDSQTRVAQFEVELTTGNRPIPGYRKKTARLRRFDLYSAESKKNALNSINFFGWKPSGSEPDKVVAKVKQLPQAGTDPRRFEGEQKLSFYGASPELIFDYYFVVAGGWQEGVPVAARKIAHKVAREGAIFTTQNFPVTRTTARYRGDVVIGEPLAAVPGTVSIYDNTLELGIDVEVGRRLAAAATAYGSDADVILGFVSKDLLPGLTGYRYKDAPRRTIGLSVDDAEESDSASAMTIAHEIGHAYGLTHCSRCAPNSRNRPPCPLRSAGESAAFCANAGISDPIEGFRLAPSGKTGWNKSQAEGNQQVSRIPGSVLSLMHFGSTPTEVAFILPSQYQDLRKAFQQRSAAARDRSEDATSHDRVARRAPPSTSLAKGLFAFRAPIIGGPLLEPEPTASASRSQEPVRPVDQQLRISGAVLRDGTNGAILSIRPANAGTGPIPAEGKLTLEALDGNGQVLSLRAFGLGAPNLDHPRPDQDDVGYFDLVVHNASRVRRIVVRNGVGAILASANRSASSPIVTLEPPTNRAGAIVLRWSARDEDSDELRYDVFYTANRSGDRSTWYPLAVDLARTELRLDRSLLERGRSPAVRVVATDGFNQGLAETAVDPGPGLPILLKVPDEGELLAVDGSLAVELGSPIDPEAIRESSFVLEDPDGERVAARVQIEARRTLWLIPNGLLIPDSTYRARLSGALIDPFGNTLGEDLTWSFRSGAALPGLDLSAETDDPPTGESPAAGLATDDCPAIDAAVLKLFLPETRRAQNVEAGATSCLITFESPQNLGQLRDFYETAILFNRYRMTRSTALTNGAEIEFNNEDLAGTVKIEENTAGCRVELVLKKE